MTVGKAWAVPASGTDNAVTVKGRIRRLARTKCFMGSFLWASWIGLLADKKKPQSLNRSAASLPVQQNGTVTTTPALVWLARFSAASFMPVPQLAVFAPGNADIGTVSCCARPFFI